MSEIVYSREAVTLAEGQTYQNPRFFSGAVSGVERVTVHGDWPAIVAAYEAACVEVAVIAPLAPPPVRHEPAPGDFGERAAAFIAEREAAEHDVDDGEQDCGVIDEGPVEQSARRGRKSK